MNLTCARARWFDIPFTREESLQAGKKVTLTFGVSEDPASITILDSVKVYGRSKEASGWSDEDDEVRSVHEFSQSNSDRHSHLWIVYLTCSIALQLPTSSASVPGQQSPLWQQLEDSLQLVEASFSLSTADNKQETADDGGLRGKALDMALQLLLLPIESPQLQTLLKGLFSALHVSSNECASRKVTELLVSPLRNIHPP